MSDYIDNLFARSLGQIEPIRPRLHSTYEDWNGKSDSEQTEDPIEFADSGIESRKQDTLDSQSLSGKETLRVQSDASQPHQPIEYASKMSKPLVEKPSASVSTPQIQQSFIEQNKTVIDVQANPMRSDSPDISAPIENKVSNPVQRIIEPRNTREVTETRIESQPIQPAPLKNEHEDRVIETPSPLNSVVKVSIGRIQVQVPPATTAVKPQFASVTRRPKFRPSMSLDEYMDKRGR